MRRRLYFLLPDLGSAIQTANDLLLARLEDQYMHFLAKRGMSLGALHEANTFQKSDAVHGAELGFVIGGVGGFLIGIYIYLTPPDGVTLQLVTVLLSTVIGAIFGAWAASLVAMSVPNSRLKPFQKEIDAGKSVGSESDDFPDKRGEEGDAALEVRCPLRNQKGICRQDVDGMLCEEVWDCGHKKLEPMFALGFIHFPSFFSVS